MEGEKILCDKRILVTGATGYLGYNIAKGFQTSGYQVFAIVRNSSDISKLLTIIDESRVYCYDGSLECMINILKTVRPDIVVHLAAKFVAEHKTSDVDELLKSNIVFSSHLFEAMSVSGVKRLVNTSTSWQNYNGCQYNPVSLYAAGKQAVEDILEYYIVSNQIEAITLVIYDSYGPDDPRGKVMSLFRKLSESGEVLNMSPGRQKIDLIYVSDIVDAYCLAVTRLLNQEIAQSKKYFLRSGTDYSLREVAEMYERVKKVKLNINWGGREYRKREVMDIAKNGETLPGWNPKISLEEGIGLI